MIQNLFIISAKRSRYLILIQIDGMNALLVFISLLLDKKPLIIYYNAVTMKGNAYRKLYRIDRFARRFYCKHARLGQLRMDKRAARKRARRDVNENMD